MYYILGVDIGTTGTKSILMNEVGNIISSAYKGYRIYSSRPSYVEQNANDWWNAVVETVRQCTLGFEHRQNIVAISLSSQGGSMVPVCKEGNPLSNAVVWMDTRAELQGSRITKEYGENYLYHKTGWHSANCFNFLQILWMKENDYELFSKTYKFLSTIDYINYKLCGKFVIDQTNAGITQLYNIVDKCWDKDIMNICGIDQSRLSDIIDSGQIIGELTNNASQQLGLPQKVLLISGAHDQYSATIGSGVTKPGDVLLSCGTSWGIMSISDKLVFSDTAYFSPGLHIVKNMYGVLTYTPAGGAALEWYRNNMAMNISDKGIEAFKEIDAKISGIPAGSENIYFFPHFGGTSCPTWSDKNRGTIMGLNFNHTRYHIAKACMEGVVYDIKWMLEKLKEKGLVINKLRALGGASKSQQWMQIASDILGLPVITSGFVDAPVLGAAIIAGVGAGLFNNYINGYECIESNTSLIEPNLENTKTYIYLFEEYKRRFELLRQCYN